jgi:hypothetical protein
MSTHAYETYAVRYPGKVDHYLGLDPRTGSMVKTASADEALVFNDGNAAGVHASANRLAPSPSHGPAEVVKLKASVKIAAERI